MKDKKINYQKILKYFVLISLILTIVFLVWAMIVAPSVMNPSDPFARTKNDYVLILCQCILGAENAERERHPAEYVPKGELS